MALKSNLLKSSTSHGEKYNEKSLSKKMENTKGNNGKRKIGAHAKISANRTWKRKPRKFLAFLLLTYGFTILLPGSVLSQDASSGIWSLVPGMSSLHKTLFNKQSVFPGIRNVMGGLVGADSVHNKCMQKEICKQFAPEIVKTEERFDPVKRSLVPITKVVQERGKLRWIGDALAYPLKRLARGLGVRTGQDQLLKRQGGGVPPTLVAAVADFVVKNWNKIPVNQMFHVMDFATDTTNIMDRSGSVYPFAKSATLGYTYGGEKNDDFEGVCSQIAPDCEDGMWGHLQTVNQYNGGAMSRDHNPSNTRSRLARVKAGGDDPLRWNNVEMRDLAKPKVFLCKAGRFLRKVNNRMESEDMRSERFGSERFEETCDPIDLEERPDLQNIIDEEGGDDPESLDTLEDSSPDAALPPPLLESEIEILDIRETEDIDDLPIIVFEGLPNPGEDQSDEDLVESVLKLANIPEASVRRAVRLPMRTRDLKSLVLVELDTKSHQKEVLDNRSLIRSSPALSVLFKSLYGKSFNNASLKIGIRRARYKELWKYIQDLLTVKFVNTEILAGITSGLSSADNNQTSQTTLETTLSTTSAEENAISDVSEETDTTTQPSYDDESGVIDAREDKTKESQLPK